MSDEIDYPGMTAAAWLIQAEKAVKDMDLTKDGKAQVIAAFIQAAAQDQHTITIRSLAEAGLLDNNGSEM